MLGRYLGSEEFPLDAAGDPVEIKMPSGLANNPDDEYADVITVGCRNGDDTEFLEWNLYPTEDNANNEAMPALKTSLNIKMSANEVKFLANTLTGTGTLQVGFWKR